MARNFQWGGVGLCFEELARWQQSAYGYMNNRIYEFVNYSLNANNKQLPPPRPCIDATDYEYQPTLCWLNTSEY